MEIIKPLDLWSFREFARYLLSARPWYLVQFRIYAESRDHGPRPILLQGQRAQSPEVGVQWSSIFRLHPLWTETLLLSTILFPSLSVSLGQPSSSYHPLPLPLSSALLSRAAPSRVHPIPGFNWDINKVCLALASDQLSLGIGIEALPIQLVLHNGNVKFCLEKKVFSIRNRRQRYWTCSCLVREGWYGKFKMRNKFRICYWEGAGPKKWSGRGSDRLTFF